jgi:DNA-binding LacI/PurR family transcriptional regulator
MKKNTPKTITLRDVAALAEMDTATVSRALSGKGYVSQQRREAALKAAKELNFQPNLHARRLVQGRDYNTIAHLPPLDLGVLTEQTFFIAHQLDEMDLEVQIYNAPRWIHHFGDKQVAMVNKVRQQRPGAIISGVFLVPEAVQELQLFIQEGGVVISYGDKIDLECDQVLFDNAHRAYIATRHLLELGHRDLGFCFHGLIPQESTELDGFAQALEEFGVPVQEKWLFSGGDYEVGGARLAEAFLGWREKPTGLCIVNDVSASTFVTVLARNGLSVPDDISVVGFDDAPAARYALVPLTTASYPLETIGRQVVEFTHSRLKGYDGPPRTTVVHSELVVRSSAAPYRPKGRFRTRISSASSTASLLSPEVVLPGVRI